MTHEQLVEDKRTDFPVSTTLAGMDWRQQFGELKQLEILTRDDDDDLARADLLTSQLAEGGTSGTDASESSHGA